MARERAPGLARHFAVERWPEVTPAIVEQVRVQFAAQEADGRSAPVYGSDRDMGAIEAARANAERAGVLDDLTLGVHAVSAVELPGGGPGWIVTNPPYGVRVGEGGRVRDLWAQIGHVLRDRAQGWRVALLSPDQTLERQLRLPLRVAATTSNGGIPVRVIVCEVP